MKKEYINPTICVVTLNTVGMLANSLSKNQETVTDEKDVLSMEFFDDDEEEEW